MVYPSYSRHISSNGPLTFASSEDLSFVIGAFLGDGSFVEDSAWHHHVKLAVRDRELADAFNCSVAKNLEKKGERGNRDPRRGKGLLRIKVLFPTSRALPERTLGTTPFLRGAPSRSILEWLIFR